MVTIMLGNLQTFVLVAKYNQIIHTNKVVLTFLSEDRIGIFESKVSRKKFCSIKILEISKKIIDVKNVSNGMTGLISWSWVFVYGLSSMQP